MANEVLAGVCKGLTDKEIADTLYIKPSTSGRSAMPAPSG